MTDTMVRVAPEDSGRVQVWLSAGQRAMTLCSAAAVPLRPVALAADDMWSLPMTAQESLAIGYALCSEGVPFLAQRFLNAAALLAGNGPMRKRSFWAPDPLWDETVALTTALGGVHSEVLRMLLDRGLADFRPLIPDSNP